MPKLNLIGEKYNLLTVIKEGEGIRTSGGNKKTSWICQCDCGNIIEVPTRTLRNGERKSCGCNKNRVRITHGHSKRNNISKEYIAWANMIQRCHNPNATEYHNYGARGITVCDEWKEDFQAFYDYIGLAPSEAHSIDRLDPNRNYEPGNVVWGTNVTQGIRKRKFKNNTSGVTGISLHKKTGKWTAFISINKKCHNLGYFDTKEEAIAIRKAAEKKYYKPLLEE